MKSGWIYAGMILFFGVFLILMISSVNFSEEEKFFNETCIDINHLQSFEYSACYDTSSKNLLLEIVRGADGYSLEKAKVSFYGISKQKHALEEIPLANNNFNYKIPSDKNPRGISLSFQLKENGFGVACPEPRKIFVRDCKIQRSSGKDILLNGKSLEDFSPIREFEKTVKIVSEELLGRELYWKSLCVSDWTCSEWEPCENGVQKRSCEDKKNCAIPISLPITAKYCETDCVEDWSCEWSFCQEGFTSPTCEDKNRCGTNYAVPEKIKCDFEASCVPDVECSYWSACTADYNFIELVEKNVKSIKGSRSRVCKDANSCVSPVSEIKSCSLGVDIYTKKSSKCGVEYVEIYNNLGDELISVFEEGGDDFIPKNIYLDGKSKPCETCFDGVLNGDESGVDCGGGCKPCDAQRDLSAKSPYDRFIEWIGNIFR